MDQRGLVRRRDHLFHSIRSTHCAHRVRVHLDHLWGQWGLPQYPPEGQRLDQAQSVGPKARKVPKGPRVHVVGSGVRLVPKDGDGGGASFSLHRNTWGTNSPIDTCPFPFFPFYSLTFFQTKRHTTKIGFPFYYHNNTFLLCVCLFGSASQLSHRQGESEFHAQSMPPWLLSRDFATQP